MRPRRWALLLSLPLVGACELTETTVPPGESVVVLQSIVSRTRGEQWVFLEYSLAGAVLGGPTGSLAPPQSPRLPITGAFVTVEHLGPGVCQGRRDTLLEAPLVTPGALHSGIYRWNASCPLEPGHRLRVRGETPAGEVVTGTTTIPGANGYAIRVGTTQAAFPLDELGMNRLRDTLRIGVDPLLARAMQIEVRRAERQEDVAIYVFTDSLGISFAGNLINPFESDGGETVFRAGRYYLLTVAVTDSNYYDFIRTRSDPITGRGFLNHLEGGVGVFGSVEAQSWLLAVRAPQSDPREGQYHIEGNARGAPVDLLLDVYVDELASDSTSTHFSAFVDGEFYLGTVRRSGDGVFLSGTQELFFQFDVSTVDGVRQMVVRGAPVVTTGAAFPVEFSDANDVHDLTMRRVP
ncbi:MAG: hypothetical protein WD934_11600 [Gemmatimonadales bacterium]